MFTILHTVKTAAQKRLAYMRTARELKAMPLDVALDLNIYRGDADRIAHKAVYGY